MKKIDQTFWDQTLSSGRLLLQMGPKRISLLEAGQLIDKNHFKKYQDSNLVLDVCTDQDKYQEYVSLFSDLKNKKFEKDQRELAKKILKAVFEDWKKEQTHLLTFATACFDSFNTLPREELVKIDNTDLRLFKKAIYASAIAVVAAISNDYFEFNLIKDLYLVTFVLDVGLCDTNYSYHIAMAVDEESKLAGAGIDYLKTVHASEKEHELFLKHPEKSHDLIESLAFNMSYPELSEIVLYQHETTQGSGFPRGVTKREISTWDAVCLYADGVVMMSSLDELEKTPLKYLLEKSFEKQDHLPIKKIFLRIKNAISYFDNYSLEEKVAS